jgi:nitrate reductase gamma subunit
LLELKMNLVDLVIGRILPYLALVVGVGGLLLRLGNWLRIPVPFRLTIFPQPGRRSGKIVSLWREIFLQTTLRHSSFGLWLVVWLFHLSLAAILAGHVLGLSFPENPFEIFSLSAPVGKQLSSLSSTGAGAVLILALLILLARRLFVPMVRRYCQGRSYFEILLLLFIALSGQALRLNPSHDLLPETNRYLAGLFQGKMAPLPQSPWFLAHFLLVIALLFYLPFSRLLHLIGSFLHRLLLLDRPALKSGSPSESRPSPKSKTGFARTER